MSRQLTPLQTAIVKRVSNLERITENRLCNYLASYFRGIEEADDAWNKEFALAIDLLVLYGLVRIENTERKGRIVIDAQRSPEPEEAAPPAQESSPPWPMATAAALLAAGCSLLPTNTTAPHVVPPQAYGDGTTAPSRIEQFYNGRSLVYRYCVDEECPSPTPKIQAQLAVAASTAAAPRYNTAAELKTLTHPQYAQAATAATRAGAATIAAKATTAPKATVDAAAAGAGLAGAATLAAKPVSPQKVAVGTPAPTLLASMTTVETGPVSMGLKADTEFTSYKGMVGFYNGSQVLDGMNRQKVAELAPQAREATHVRLRGHAGTTPTMSEDMKKLAVGRAYAVKVEFTKHDVAKEKIRILNPRPDAHDAPTASVRRVDIMLDMPAKKTLAAMGKEGA